MAGVSRERHGICRYCGKKTAFKEVCDVCAIREAKRLGWSYQCFNCKAKDVCESHDMDKWKGRCRICGAVDGCMPVRGGLCLDCFAKQWNREHPIKWHDATVEEYTERNME